jgi:hypothetical protein
MAKGPEDLRRIAEMGPDFRLNSKYMGTQKAPADPAMGGSPITPDARREVSNDIMRQVGVNEGAEGGLGVGGSQDWTYISELAQMMREKPEFFRFRGAQEGGATHEENWMNFVDRIITQVPGLKAKTGSFGGVWQDPVRAGTSAVDRHMLAILGDNLFSSPREAASFKRQMVKDWNSSVKTWNKANPKARPRSRINAVEDLATTPGGTDYFNEKMFGVVNAVSEPKMRVRGTGDVNEAIPPHLHPDQADYVYEPDKAVLTSEAYKRAQQATAQTAARPGSTGLFSDQWYVWDPQRRRFEPHEIKNPGLTSVPRQSQRQLQEAYQAHNEAGYLDYSKDAEGKLNPVQPVTFKEGEALTEPRQQMATILGGLNPSRLAAFQWLAALLGGGAASGLALSRRQRPAGSDRAPLVGGT